MGHFHSTVRAVGRDRDDAEQTAINDFMYENGHRHNLREVESAKFIRRVPPKKQVSEKRPNPFPGSLTVIYITEVDDTEAPAEKWLQEWEFVLHTHA